MKNKCMIKEGDLKKYGRETDVGKRKRKEPEVREGGGTYPVTILCTIFLIIFLV